MTLNEDGSITIDRDAAILIAREKHRQYSRAKRNHDWYVAYYQKFPERRLAYSVQAIKYKHLMDSVYEWENIYNLLLKGKHVKKPVQNSGKLSPELGNNEAVVD